MKAKQQWELYTNEELQGGAQKWGLTVEQERQRLRIVQSDFRSWPKELLDFLKAQHSTNLEFVGFTVIQHSVVAWLKAGNTFVVVETAETIVIDEPELAAVAA
jgi:hypothetical protein